LISDQELPKAIKLMEKADLTCPIKNALNLTVEVHPQFEFMNSEERVNV